MRKIIMLLAGIAFSMTILLAQESPPQAFSFKASIKRTNGIPVINRPISLRASILQTSTDGIAVYTETFNPTTNIVGQVDIEIGRGTVEFGDFSLIDWSTSEYFLKIEADISGGLNFKPISVTQLLSVPYALFAGDVKNRFSGDFNDLINKPDITTSPNILIGPDAGKNTISDFGMIAIGDSALFNNELTIVNPGDAKDNIAIGLKSLYSNTSGHNNIAVGIKSLSSNISGHYNTAVGVEALLNNTTGGFNTAYGYRALYHNQTGASNTAIGEEALLHNTTGILNTAIGGSVMLRNTEGSYNSAIGRRALQYNISGHYNSAFGYEALNNNSTGKYNSAIGSEALYGNSSGSYNTASGYQALAYNTTGYSNVAIGVKALCKNTNRSNLVAIGDSALFNNGLDASEEFLHEATRNTAVGSKSLFSNTTGYSNTAVGSYSLYSNTTGESNTATGSSALANNITGIQNTANGSGALSNNDGSFNTAIGHYALFHNTNGSSNIAIGAYALEDNISGSYNIANGNYALAHNINGTHNTAIGGGAVLYWNESGTHNTAVGHSALDHNSTGSYNTAVGYKAGHGLDTDGLYHTNLLNTGAFGYYSTATTSNTIVLGNSATNAIGGAVEWSIISDGRFKTDVKANVPGLEFITKLNPVTFKWNLQALDQFRGISDSSFLVAPEIEKARLEKEKKVYSGFVAQEVEKAADECGYDFSAILKPSNERTPYNLSYAEFVVPLVKAVQELSAQNQELKAQTELLKKQYDELKKTIDDLKE